MFDLTWILKRHECDMDEAFSHFPCISRLLPELSNTWPGMMLGKMVLCFVKTGVSLLHSGCLWLLALCKHLHYLVKSKSGPNMSGLVCTTIVKNTVLATNQMNTNSCHFDQKLIQILVTLTYAVMLSPFGSYEQHKVERWALLGLKEAQRILLRS